MKRLTLIAIAGCTLVGAPLLAQEDRAVPRGGGGGASSHVGARHTGSPSGSSSPSHGAPSATAPSSNLTDAQRRHPRAGTGSGSRGGYGYWGGRPPGGGYYPPHYWGGWYSPSYGWGYWWPYGAYGWSGYWGYPWGAGAVYHYVQSDRGAVRVLIDPPDARVYVDGYYAGIVDDFDGLFQRLHVAPGRHEIQVKLGGYKTYRVRVYVGSGATLKLDYELEEGVGEVFEDLAGDRPEWEARYDRPVPYTDDRASGESPPPAGETDPSAGELRLRVEPDDASVYVDGVFRGTGHETGALRLAPGRHQVEVVRPGFRTEEREVEVGSRDVTELTIELRRP